MPIHQGSSYVIGQLAGSENVTLTVGQMPQHTHNVSVQAGPGTQQSLSNAMWAGDSSNIYAPSRVRIPHWPTGDRHCRE